jgi:hypothetical protein
MPRRKTSCDTAGILEAIEAALNEVADCTAPANLAKANRSGQSGKILSRPRPHSGQITFMDRPQQGDWRTNM